MKDNDVYSFSYSKETRDKESYPGQSQHCFDGQLIARNSILWDTYWLCTNDGRKGTYQEWKSKGTLKKLFNLDDMQEIQARDLCYYNDSDIKHFHRQHGCYTKWLIRKGTKKSITKIRKVLIERIKSAEYDIEYKTREIIRLKEQLAKTKEADFTIEGFYI